MSLHIRAASPEPMLFAQVSGRPKGNFNQKTIHMKLLMDRVCAVKDLFDGRSEESFSRDAEHMHF